MKQSRLMSLAESLANVLVGYGVAMVTQMLVFPLFGLIFTAVSIVRSYALRRGFEALLVRQSVLTPDASAVNLRH